MGGTQNAKAVFVVTSPPSDRDIKRFGLATLQDAGIQTQLWDLSPLYHPNSTRLPLSDSSWVDLSRCSSLEDLRALCETLTTDHVVIFIGGLDSASTWCRRQMLRLIFATPARLTTISLGHLPVLPLKDVQGAGQRLRSLNFVTRLRDGNRWRSLYRRLIITAFISRLRLQRRVRFGSAIRPLDRIWAGTRVSGIAQCHTNRATNVTFIHSLDYDFVLNATPAPAFPSPYFVFIDQMGPLHPDVELLGLTFPLSMEKYSSMVCRGLAHIEAHLGLKAVIAAHPRASPGALESWYNGRQVIYGNTPALIAHASAVASESSTSIGLAAVHRKSIVLMTADVMFPESQMYTHALCDALGTDLLDLDALEFPPLALEVDENKYRRYVEEFVKRPHTPEQPFWSVVASEILSGNI